MSAMRHTTAALRPTGEVRFRRDGDRLLVDHATPVMWLARHVLDYSRAEADVGLSCSGDYVTLRANNGRWVWKLTGRSCRGSFGPDGERFVMLEGVWPD